MLHTPQSRELSEEIIVLGNRPVMREFWFNFLFSIFIFIAFKSPIFPNVIFSWICPSSNHAQILFESFDHDSSTRRVAPIGVRQNEKKIIDLSNGVFDNSCCFGYSCLLRLTQNYVNLECDQTYQFHTTGTLPKKDSQKSKK